MHDLSKKAVISEAICKGYTLTKTTPDEKALFDDGISTFFMKTLKNFVFQLVCLPPFFPRLFQAVLVRDVMSELDLKSIF